MLYEILYIYKSLYGKPLKRVEELFFPYKSF